MLVFLLSSLTFHSCCSWYSHKYLSFKGVFFSLYILLCSNILLLFYELYTLWLFNNFYEITCFHWVELGNNINIFFALRGDLLNLLLVFMMTSGSLFVFWFVFIDMWDDKENYSFLINLSFFLIFMIILVTSSNLILFYLGWEGIGIMSLVLVSFWTERVRSFKATFKIFLITKIGDLFILALFSFLLLTFNESDFYVLNNMSHLLFYKPWYITESLAALLVLSGSVKSAQLGFHIWLLEAMEAPLGASALMHSSTLVIAGIVLILKLLPFLFYSILCINLVYYLSLITASVSAFIACFQYELKIIMAYSTISNMGYLLMLLSLNAMFEFFFLIILHAYIKIFLFLTLGALILHANGCQDLRWLSQLSLHTPTLYGALFFGLLNLSGLPLWSGYSCKCNILLAHLNNPTVTYLNDFILGFSYICTFVYNFRLFFLLFYNIKLGHKHLYAPKNTSLLLILNFVFLGVGSLSIHFFWGSYLKQAITTLHYGNLLNLTHALHYNHVALNTYYYYLWWFTYLIFFLIIFLFKVLNLNKGASFFKNWAFLSALIYILSLYFLVICFDSENKLICRVFIEVKSF